uniref:Uncharacterized protein n=2 Tax=Aplanochytrium stocchinoi TaxID=215587 RepID=A0A7S3LMF3_9STRA
MNSQATEEAKIIWELFLYNQAVILYDYIIPRLRYGNQPITAPKFSMERVKLLETLHKNKQGIINWPNNRKRNSKRFVRWYNVNILAKMTAGVNLERLSCEKYPAWQDPNYWTLNNEADIRLNESESVWLFETISYLHWYRTPSPGSTNFSPDYIAAGAILRLDQDSRTAELVKKFVLMYALRYL